MSCKKTNEADANKPLVEKPISMQCYQALYEKDTIMLEVNQLKDEKITGTMLMKIDNMPPKNGNIKGESRGDTLFVDYSFIQGTNDKVTYKNPMALLKRGNDLILGNGQIETYMGASYFAKGKPIDFDNVKYKFTPVDCSDKE
jgi:hypothetical protein